MKVQHLTGLLAEAESDSTRLSELTATLKEELRREMRNQEREQHLKNNEYLKNIIFKVSVTCKLISLN